MVGLLAARLQPLRLVARRLLPDTPGRRTARRRMPASQVTHFDGTVPLARGSGRAPAPPAPTAYQKNRHHGRAYDKRDQHKRVRYREGPQRGVAPTPGRPAGPPASPTVESRGEGHGQHMAPDAGRATGRATNGVITALAEGITVAEAATRAGISRAAARKRLRRGSWRAWKAGGEWRIDPASLEAEVALPPSGPAGSATAPDGGRPAADPALLEALRDEVAYLRRKLDERDEELRRQTITIAQLVSRLPQLPAPAEGGGQAETRDGTARGEGRRRWWRRLLWGVNQSAPPRP